MASNEIVKFPEDFLLGTGSSAYQVEGAWDVDGKTPSIWDDFFHSEQNEKIEFVCPHHHFTPQQIKDKIADVAKHAQNDIKQVEQSAVKNIQQEAAEIKSLFKGFHILKKKSRQLCDNLTLNGMPKNVYTKKDGGMIACDAYNKTDTDVQLLKDLGVQVYRFSLSWPRLLPQGDDSVRNEKGIEYYKNLIKKLRENGIEPMVTIYHWDLPASLQKIGGWSNKNIIRFFENYCDFVFATFGNEVKYWSTINEPRLIAEGYCTTHSAPALGDNYSGIVDYMVVQNLLLGHAYAYQLYNAKYRATQQGQISLCLDAIWFFPHDKDNEEHKAAAELAYQSYVGIFVQPLVTGEYPEVVVKSVIETNKRENKKIWRIVGFTDHEKSILKDAYDFIAFNYYYSWIATPVPFETRETLRDKDIGVTFKQSEIQEDINEGFRNVIHWFDEVLNHPKIFVCENGFSEPEGVDKSLEKKQFHYGMLCEVDKAIKNNIKLIGYCVWSFMDSLEWVSEYKNRYGIYRVDFNDEKRPRYKKEKTYKFFETLFKTKTLPPPEIE